MATDNGHASCAPSPSPTTPFHFNLPLPPMDWTTVANGPEVDIREWTLGDLNVALFAIPNHVAGLELLAQAGEMALQQEQRSPPATNGNAAPVANSIAGSSSGPRRPTTPRWADGIEPTSQDSTPIYQEHPLRGERVTIPACWDSYRDEQLHFFSHQE